VIAVLLLVTAGVWVAVSRIKDAREAKRVADVRRRESMREVTEKWHFREWERDLRSSDSL
jgi:cytidylate kinase